MALVNAAGDIIEVSFCMRLNNQNGINVRHYRVQTIAGTGATDAQITAFFESTFKSTYLPCIANAAVWYGTKCQRIFPLPKSGISTTSGGVSPGTGGASPLPTQVAGLISHTTALAGRSYRGRKYIPFPTTTQLTAAGDPTPAYITLLNSICVADVSTLTAGTTPNQTTFKPVIWSPRRQVATDLSNSFGRTGWGTQRRRGDIRRPDVVPW